VLHPNLGHIADPLRHPEITLHDVTNSRYQLGLFVENQKIELVKKANWTWAPVQRLYVLVSSLHALTEGAGCVEISLRPPNCVWTSKGSLVTRFWRKAIRRRKRSTYKAFSMSIGAPTCVNSLYRVSRDNRPVRSCLTEKGRGRCHWKESGVSRITILCGRYCSSLYHSPSLPANNDRVGGISTLVAQRA